MRNIADVTTAVATGDLSKKITVDVKGEVLELKNTINTMVDQLSSFADEVTRVAREVGTEGRLGGQAKVKGVSGTWKDLTDNVNAMADNLTDQVRNIADVTTAVATGDLSKKITVDARGEVLELKETINTMVDQLRSFAAEVTRVAKEVGTEGRLGGQANVEGVSGTWKDLTDNVNTLADNLTTQVRNIAEVTTAVATGDLSKKITVNVKGEILQLKNTINTMVDQLSSFADEVTRVAREVGTEGKLGGQAKVKGVSGTWKDLTDNVNTLADNLTNQVRNIAEVTTAVAKGELSKKITVDARGEILELKNTINTMVDQLSTFAAEVTRVAKEVGTEGKLGVQAQVEGVSGVWKGLTDNVNQLAGTLTTQLRAISEVSQAVTQGDLTRSIAVEAEGEVAELKNTINQMIENLAETTRVNTEQDWLNSNMARFTGMLQGERDLETVSRLIMSELTPLVGAQHGAFFMMDSPDGEGDDFELRLVSTYGYKQRKNVPNKFKVGEALVGQAALEQKPILVTQAPDDYVRISSGLGEGTPINLIVLPVLFEDQVLAVIELASFQRFANVQQAFLEQLSESIGVVLNTIQANMRTEELLAQSQGLTQELQSQSEELQAQQEELQQTNKELEEQAASLKASEELLQTQQEELQQTNEELEEKAQLLEEQNRRIEIKNREIELARAALEEKAEQLSLSSRYKSEFLANMSHELRTPLNSLLILAKLLGENSDANLNEKQIEFANTIYGAGSDLLVLINDILDLSKVEAGRMDVNVSDVKLSDLRDFVERSFRPVAEDKTLDFEIEVRGANVPPAIETDEQRLQQVIKNLLSNAFKFTESGGVKLRIGVAEGRQFASEALSRAEAVLEFTVEDTGVGIAHDKLRLIFEAFQQADGTTSRRYGGTGLGLSISREIARLLGGEIHVRISSGLGEGAPVNVIVLPVLFEDQVLAVVELASFQRFSSVQQSFLEQLAESIGVVLNTIQANMRTEELLVQSQDLTQELQSQSEELQAQQEELQQTNKELEEQAASLKASEELLQTQQEELQQTNEELEEKAQLLEEQNRRIEIKNREIELARAALEEKAEQLSLSSRYKSEFLANMSHELRTPLNSLLILAKLLSENPESNLNEKQIEFANTIYGAGSDLLEPDQRHPRPFEGRGGPDGRQRQRRQALRPARLRRALVPAGRRGQGRSASRSRCTAQTCRPRSRRTSNGCNR